MTDDGWWLVYAEDGNSYDENTGADDEDADVDV